MNDYLKRAFLLRVPVAGLGRFPLNVAAVLGFGILGLGNPAFWLLGAGIEAGYLALVATNPRFQRLVAAQRSAEAVAHAGNRRDELVSKLSLEARRRYEALEQRCAKALAVGAEAAGSDFGVEAARDSLNRLSWLYLKLLVARHYLEASRVSTSTAALDARIAELDRALAQPASAALRESQLGTRRIIEQRRENLGRCEETLREVDSDLARIEAQVDLAVENANLRGGGVAGAANLQLASQILENGLYFGAEEQEVAALDEAYGEPPPVRRLGVGSPPS
jgi:hypothetical protein